MHRIGRRVLLMLLIVKIHHTFGNIDRLYYEGFTYCLTLENFPMFFERVNSTQFKGYPEKHEYSYFCNLGEDTNCDTWWLVNDWKRVNSFDTGMNHVLIDERWEDIQVLQLKDKLSNGTLKYTKLLSLDKYVDSLTMAWSISKGAELYFCSEENLIHSHCIKMTFNNGVEVQKVGIIKEEPITLQNGTNWADGRWRIFQFQPNKTSVYLTDRYEPFYFPHPGIYLKHIFGRSNDSMDFVKIQNYSFLRTEIAGFYQIGRPFYLTRGSLHFSLYVAMCKTCKMIFMMAGIEVALVESVEEGYWLQVVIKIGESPDLYQQLYVFLIGDDHGKKENDFWAIDYVRRTSSGFRAIKIPGNYSCKILYPEGQAKSIEKREYIESLKPDRNISTNLKMFRIIYFDTFKLSFMYQNNLGDEDKISIVSEFSQQVFGRPRRFTTKAKPQKCRLWPDFSCVSVETVSGFYSSLNKEKVEINLSFFQPNGMSVGFAQFSLPPPFYNKYKIAQAPVILSLITGTTSNDFVVAWQHPYVDGGNMKGFLIRFISYSPSQKKLKEFFVNVEIKHTKNAYSKRVINSTYESCDRYFIQVRPINEFGLGFAATELVRTPPVIPSISIRMEKRNASLHFSIEPVDLTRCREEIENFTRKIYILLSRNEDNHNISAEIMELDKILNETLSETYSAIKKFTINESDENIDFEFPTEGLGDGRHLMFVEVLNYVWGTKYYEHVFDFEGTSERSGEKDTPQVLILIGIIVVLLICCCYIIARRFKKKRDLLRMMRPRTIADVHFSGDRIELMGESFLNSSHKIDGKLGENKKMERGSNEEILEEPRDYKPVKIADFEKYVRLSMNNNDFSRQFESLPENLTKPCEVGKLECNKPKNRFEDILPYEHSRVKLAVLKNKEGSDYINANYIKGYKRSKSFIAAQGPKSLTINDFWRMVWQENVRNIIMLVNLEESGAKKVEKYWPSYNEDFQFDKIHVFYHSSETFADYEIRVFRLVCEESERKVLQYHYKNWPDNGVPIVFQSLVSFIKKTMEIQSKSPILVHCCSGTSATGVYILCHICLQMAQEIGVVDVFKVAKQLREQRVNMIHDVVQYKLAHLLILEYLFGLQAAIACNDDIDALVATLTDPEKLRLQMLYLEDLSWQYRALVAFSDYEDIFTICPEKNKVPDIVPDAVGGVQLERYPEMDERSSYINAIRVDGYQCSQRYIVTQQPMANTLNDFWRMVIQQEVEVIVSLNEIDLKDKKSCIIWPSEENPIISPVDFIIIKHCSSDDREIYDVIVVDVMIQGEKKKTVKVTIISFKGWKPKSKLPESITNFLKLCGFVDSMTRQHEHTIVTCYDGCLASGVYVASSYLIEMIKVEKSFDVCNTVKMIRRNRKQFIAEEVQLAFLYEVSATYIKGYQDYANFASSSQQCYNVYDYIEFS